MRGRRTQPSDKRLGAQHLRQGIAVDRPSGGALASDERGDEDDGDEAEEAEHDEGGTFADGVGEEADGIAHEEEAGESEEREGADAAEVGGVRFGDDNGAVERLEGAGTDPEEEHGE